MYYSTDALSCAADVAVVDVIVLVVVCAKKADQQCTPLWYTGKARKVAIHDD